MKYPLKIKKPHLYIIATSNEAIEEVSRFIPFEDTLVVHTSGSALINALKEKYQKKNILCPTNLKSRGKHSLL